MDIGQWFRARIKVCIPYVMVADVGVRWPVFRSGMMLLIGDVENLCPRTLPRQTRSIKGPSFPSPIFVVERYLAEKNDTDLIYGACPMQYDFLPFKLQVEASSAKTTKGTYPIRKLRIHFFFLMHTAAR